MSRKKRKISLDLEKPPMASMIDIVFLLLIFFLVNTTEAIPESHLSVNLPNKTRSIEPIEHLNIYILPKDNGINADYRIGSLGARSRSLEEVKQYITRFENYDKISVRIKTSELVYAKYALEILDFCKGLGIEKTATLTLKPIN